MEINLLELLSVLLRRWRAVVGFPVIAVLVAVPLALLLPSRYTATAVFIPEEEASGAGLPPGLGGLAAQFGVSLPGGGEFSPQFYDDLIASRSMRDELLMTRFSDARTPAAGDSATLLDLLNVGPLGPDTLARLEEGRERLEKAVTTTVDNETRIVQVSVETRHRELSAAAANRLVELVNRFNLETRQSKAKQRRRLVEQRIAEATGELREAEEALRLFLEQNRAWQGSPALVFQHDRLERRVRQKQEVVTELFRSYEEARIQEVNETPVITVVDRAVPPIERSSPRRRLLVGGALLVGTLAGLVAAFGRETMDRARARDEPVLRDLQSSWSRMKTDLKSSLRPGFSPKP